LKENKKLPDPEKFWEWFSENENLIREIFEDEYHPERNFFVNALDNFILDFGMFTWEIGSGESKSHYFIISPNGSAELLLISEHVVKQAPQLENWEFHSSRPAKAWDLKFSIYDENFNEVEVDAAEWKFFLKKSKSNKADVFILPESISHLDDDTRQRALETVVRGELGEKMRIKYIDDLREIRQADTSSAFKNISELKTSLENFSVRH
jgi:hypothetical protein